MLLGARLLLITRCRLLDLFRCRGVVGCVGPFVLLHGARLLLGTRIQAWVDVGVDLGLRLVSIHDEGLLGVDAVGLHWSGSRSFGKVLGEVLGEVLR